MPNKKLCAGAVIVAAGRGTRMNTDINKQYIEIAEKPILARTVEVFESSRHISEIILVVNESDIMYCKQSIVDMCGAVKVKAIVSGGEERQNSVYNGLCEIDKACDVVVIHDGARPFVTHKIISDSIEAAGRYGASCVAVPVKDTIKAGDHEGFISSTLERSVLWSVQTPQSFRYRLIMDAHIKAEAEGFYGTDDAVLVERLGVRTRLIMGSYENIKITTQEDLVLGEAIARLREARHENG